MNFVANVALVVLISTPAFCADWVVTKAKHKDAVHLGPADKPAEDTTEISWLGKDRMRCEEGDRVVLVRPDLKKMYMLDMKAKTVSTIDLPLDMKKYLPASMRPKLGAMLERAKAALTPTTETKKIKDWNATKYTMAVTTVMGIEFTHEIWATKDVQLDLAAFHELSAAMMSLVIGGSSMAAEYKKVEGLPVLVSRTQTMATGETIKTREEVTLVESKDAQEGWYDVPKDFTEIPYDALADGPSLRGSRSGQPAGPPPADKPKGK